MTSRHLITALFKLVVEADFKTVKVKFIGKGAKEEEVEKYIEDFKKLRDSNRIKKVNEKNIDYWGKQPFKDFTRFINDLKETKSKTQENKLKKIEGAELRGENDLWGVYKILTHEASCFYGAGTKWCVTEEDSKHWNDYLKNNDFYYFISKTKGKEDPLYKIAMNINDAKARQYWNAEDTSIQLSEEIKEELPKFETDPVQANRIVFNGKAYNSLEDAIAAGMDIKEHISTYFEGYGDFEFATIDNAEHIVMLKYKTLAEFAGDFSDDELKRALTAVDEPGENIFIDQISDDDRESVGEALEKKYPKLVKAIEEKFSAEYEEDVEFHEYSEIGSALDSGYWDAAESDFGGMVWKAIRSYVDDNELDANDFGVGFHQTGGYFDEPIWVVISIPDFLKEMPNIEHQDAVGYLTGDHTKFHFPRWQGIDDWDEAMEVAAERAYEVILEEYPELEKTTATV